MAFARGNKRRQQDAVLAAAGRDVDYQARLLALPGSGDFPAADLGEPLRR
jgi:hypothetical protein